MKTSDFDYFLPEELIAQTPVEPRDHSRLLVYHRSDRSIEHKHFYDVVDYLNPGDALVINETKVIPARLLGEKEGTGVPVEVLLLRRENATDWEALVRPGRRLKPGGFCSFGGGLLRCEILRNVEETGGRLVRFHCDGVFEEILDRLGEMPLPPYIHEKLQDSSRYQTVYAKQEGSAAAPTAGLHFTPELLQKIRAKGIVTVPVLLHVGLGTFRPVKEENAEDHVMHSEFCQVTEEAASILNGVRAAGGRIVCVGTTSVRTLETRSDASGVIHAGAGDTAIFIHPGVTLKATDALITNFHLPQSTLLMLVSALMGREEALRVYAEAVRERYRFFSFGDAMMIL
ncbi:MAG: tRNA preQ1(34) S-adenosylmethionine ribosyltransferase-isomerase QueA [Clostridia bacterium]|nr:tRNA preQ1(34) S-adenosylmethionine ribosyltransferase-isomerase QueA [Clostridia bacterium]